MNLPVLIAPKSAKISILENSDPFGRFEIRALQTTSSDNGSYVEVDELADFSIDLIIERNG